MGSVDTKTPDINNSMDTKRQVWPEIASTRRIFPINDASLEIEETWSLFKNLVLKINLLN